MTTPKPSVAVIGAGPAGLMAAETLAARGCQVTMIERMAAPARKFLLAGRGGLNLTHSEPESLFITRYGDPMDARLNAALRRFPALDVVHWAEVLDQPTFVGSSGRVFPKAMKASPLLRAWLARLERRRVTLRLRTEWRGFDTDGAVLLAQGDSISAERFDAVVLALGGASWPRLGADGSWAPVLEEYGVRVTPLTPANVGIHVAWSEVLRTRHAGQPLKRIALTVGSMTVRGEAMITRDGLEGGVIYTANDAIRRAFAGGSADITLDLRPDLSVAALIARLGGAASKQSTANTLRKLRLSPAAIGVMREAGPFPRGADDLAARIKAVPLTVTGFAGIVRAISTAGGVAFDGIDANWMLTARPGVFVAGEMVDWSAPTGGYLLTACLATGRAAADGVLDWLEARPAAA